MEALISILLFALIVNEMYKRYEKGRERRASKNGEPQVPKKIRDDLPPTIQQ